MPGTNYTKEFDDVASISNASTAPDVVDQRFKDHPVWGRIAGNKIFSTFTQDRFEVPVRAGMNKSISYFSSPTAEVNLFDQQHMTKAWYQPAILGGVIVYTDIEKEQVEGSRDAMLSLQRVKMEALEDSVDEVLSQNLYGDGAANTTLGFGALIPVSPGAYTVGALSEATYPMWQPYYLNVGGSWKNFGYFGSTKDQIARAIRMVSDGSKRVDLLICDDNNYMRYHDSLGGKVQYHRQEDYGKIGSWDLTILGIPLVPDKNCDPDTLIGVQTKYLKLVVSPGMNMKFTGMRHLEKSPLVSYDFFVFRHQLVATRRNVHFRLDGFTD